MRVFVTGATGFIGQVVVRELLGAGHTVLGLARSDVSAEALTRAGVAVHRGDLTDTESLAAGARACDGVIHLAFIHDFSRWMENIEIDRRAIETMAEALEGTGKPFVTTFGVALLTPGQTATESDTAAEGTHPRAATETIVLAAAERGVRASIVRLPPSVHGAGDHGFVPRIVDMSRRLGFAGYVGDGANRWPAVHRVDAARLYRLALEKAAPGTRLHAIAEEGVPMRTIATTIGEGLGLPVRSITPEDAEAQYDILGRFIGMDAPTSSTLTQERFGWAPREIGLIDDMRAHYFV